MKILGKISLLAVLMVFAFQQVNTLYQFIYYKTHKDEIVMEFCVNKDKPEMQCNGKCHLAKQIETEPNFVFSLKTKSKKDTTPPNSMRVIEQLLFVEHFECKLAQVSIVNEKVVDHYLLMHSDKFIQDLIHPPCT